MTTKFKKAFLVTLISTFCSQSVLAENHGYIEPVSGSSESRVFALLGTTPYSKYSGSIDKAFLFTLGVTNYTGKFGYQATIYNGMYDERNAEESIKYTENHINGRLGINYQLTPMFYPYLEAGVAISRSRGQTLIGRYSNGAEWYPVAEAGVMAQVGDHINFSAGYTYAYTSEWIQPPEGLTLKLGLSF
ncbi:exported hypothetical protein [Vibrio chagasii]|nr:exported hypothetical protein [Vibrio chagasii]